MAGRRDRTGITIFEPARMFPDEDAARRGFKGIVWPDGERYCPRCGSLDTYECRHKRMPYRCRAGERWGEHQLGRNSRQ